MKDNLISTTVTPERSLDILSQIEVEKLRDSSKGGLYHLWRHCSLAVLNCGSKTDDSVKIIDQYKSFNIKIIQQQRGIKLALTNAPGTAFVDGKMIKGIKEHLFAILRDLIYFNIQLNNQPEKNQNDSSHITNSIFHILRNAKIIQHQKTPNLIVCWGGHSIPRREYVYSKEVGHQLGLRRLNVCTGCGPGAMKGPMKGATIGHAKQRFLKGRYIGISEPGIIAAESPNPIVNDLVIMPDIEKRLESFVRVAHGIIVFPGGVGTAEEILYLLGLMLHPENSEIPLPLIFTGPKHTEDYFNEIDKFIVKTVGKSATNLYRIIIDDPDRVARELKENISDIRAFRIQQKDAFYFNWQMKIEQEFQLPFEPTHESMRKLELSRDLEPYKLAANLRRVFSGIVAGNVKEEGIRQIQKYGPFEIKADKSVLEPINSLLNAFVAQHRMKLTKKTYKPCYKII